MDQNRLRSRSEQPVRGVGQSGIRFKERPSQTEGMRRLRVDFKQLWQAVQSTNPLDIYHETHELLRRADYSPRDVEEFSIEMAEFQEGGNFAQKAGAVLSAMVNAGDNEHYTIHTDHLRKRIDFLGYKNRSNMSIRGDVGNSFCDHMEGGLVFVTGNIYGAVGTCMKGGEIIVEKNVYGHVGGEMEDGMITVVGSVGKENHIHISNEKIIVGDPSAVAGVKMKGGKIVINGNSGPFTGIGQEGGLIETENAGSEVGPRREGGKIIIRGSYESLGRSAKGETYRMEDQVLPAMKNGGDVAVSHIGFAFMAYQPSQDTAEAYEKAADLAGQLKYHSDDVKRFSRSLGRYQMEADFCRKAGLFLSALVNSGPGLFYTLDLRKITYGINLIGYRNRRTLRVKGDVGAHAGRENTGTMIVEGSTGYGTGAHMKEGRIIVARNTGDFLGIGMKEGRITVLGDAGFSTGHCMCGGIATVNGDIGSIGETNGGKLIYGLKPYRP